MLGIAGKRVIEGSQSVVEAALVVENIAAKKQRLETCGLLLQERVAGRERFFQALQLLQRGGRAIERFAVGRDKPKGGAEAFFSLGVLAERGEYRSAIVPSRFIRRVGGKRFAQRLKGVVNAAIVIEEKRFGRERGGNGRAISRARAHMTARHCRVGLRLRRRRRDCRLSPRSGD